MNFIIRNPVLNFKNRLVFYTSIFLLVLLTLSMADRLNAQRALTEKEKIEKMRTDIAEILRNLKSDDPSKRENASLRLDKFLRVNKKFPSSIGREIDKTIPSLTDLLSRCNTYVTYQPIDLLSRIGPKAVPGLISLLKSEHWCARYAAVRALGQMGPAANRSLPHILKLKNDPVRIVRAYVGLAVHHINPSQAGAVSHNLFEVLKLKAQLYRREALRFRGVSYASGISGYAQEALIKLGKESVPVLVTGLEDKDEIFRRNILFVIGRIGPEAEEAAPYIVKFLKSKSRGERTAAAGVLGLMGENAGMAIPYLQECLNDKEEIVRIRAGIAIAAIDRKAAPSMVKYLLLGIKKIKEEFSGADFYAILKSFGPGDKAALPELMKWIYDKDVQVYIFPVLGNMGKEAGEALPHLKKILKDESITDSYIKKMISGAIKKIETK